MLMEKWLFALITLILFMSCKNEVVENGYPICFQTGLSADDLEIEYEILDIHDAMFLGAPDQLECDDYYIYLLYSLTANAGVYVFDKTSGDYITKIGHRGRGKGEYILPLSVTLSDTSVYIVDGGKNILLKYKKKDFSYESSQDIHDIGYFEWVTDTTLLCDNNMYDKKSPYYKNFFLLADADFDIQNGMVDKMIVSGYVTGPIKPMYQYGEEVRAYTPFRPYIYSFDSREMNTVYQLSFEKLSFPPENYIQKIASGNKDYTGHLMKSGYISYFDFWETEENIMSLCMAEGKRYLGFYSKQTGISGFWTEKELSDVVPCEPLLISGIIDGKFVIAMSAIDLKTNRNIPLKLKNHLKDASESDIILQLINY